MRRWGYECAAFAAASLLTLACGTGKGSAADGATSSSAAPSAPVAVTSAPVQVAEEPVTIRATGSFTAAESSKVSPLVSGQIIATPVNVGATVKAGEVIARLDDRDARAHLAQAKATLQQAQATAANAKAQMQRSAGLVKTGDISAVDFETLITQVETANAQVAQAQAQVTVAQQQLDETIIQAPFRGHVSARPVAAGEYVTTASSIATVVQIQPIKLELQIPEADAAQVNVGMAVSAQVASYPDREFVGTITAKNPALSPESRALTVVAEFKNDDLALNPGMFASAAVKLPQTQQVISVPSEAVFTPTGSPSAQVYIAQEGKARLRVVQAGPQQGNLVPIASGLEPGDVVITSDHDKLFDGQPVTVR
ncbi:MAG TPA: efflux RND transporter periplasmic adaptor subunit [Vicinamibacterales bacterium]